jgi:hypothetical protein
MVALSFRKPCCQKMIASVDRRADEPCDDKACRHKSKETHQQPLPMTAGNNIKSSQDGGHPQQQAAEKPKSRPLGRNAPANRPPKTAEKNSTE